MARRRKPRGIWRILRWPVYVLALLVAIPVLLTPVYLFVDPVSVPMLERLPFVARFAWFSLSDVGTESRTGLYADATTLTPAGRAYLRSRVEPRFGL